MGTVMRIVEISSTIRDFPVPDELMMHVVLAYVLAVGLSRSLMVLRSASAAFPLKCVFHACTVAVIGHVTKRKVTSRLLCTT